MDLVALLRELVGDRNVLTDSDAVDQTDYTGRFRGTAVAVVRPRDAKETADVVRLCGDAAVPVVAQGGCTGLVGGGTPRGGEVVLSTTRMTSLDITGDAAVAGAGVTLGDLRRRAAAAGRRFPLDLASRDSATVGGMIATDAAGAHAAAAGSMGRQLRGVEAVLADGTILDELDGGRRLLPVIAGSEGTIAIVTRARLRLRSPLGPTTSVLIGVGSSTAAATIVGEMAELEAAEIFYRNGLLQVCDAFGFPDPLPESYPCYLLIEAVSDEATSSGALAELPTGATAVALSPSDRERLWRYRELHTDAILRRGIPIKADLRLPIDAIDSFVAAVTAELGRTYPGAEVFAYGHLLDGDLHVNVTGTDHAEHGVDESIYAEVARHGGSVVGEHGVGVAKVGLLALTEPAEALQQMRDLKRHFDPAGVLNPGVRVPEAERP